MSKPHKPLEAQGLGCGLVLSLVLMTSVLLWLGLPPGVAALIAIVLAGMSLVAYAINQYKSQRLLNQSFKQMTNTMESPNSTDYGDGTFCVVGVDKRLGIDITWQVDAASAANAKVKGELRGIIVTRVTRV